MSQPSEGYQATRRLSRRSRRPLNLGPGLALYRCNSCPEIRPIALFRHGDRVCLAGTGLVSSSAPQLAVERSISMETAFQERQTVDIDVALRGAAVGAVVV